jgi:hypothetical protein
MKKGLIHWIRSLVSRAELDPFEQSAERSRARILAYRPRRRPVGGSGTVGVIVSPWQRTAVPFYAVEWAVRLRKEGLNVEFIWDVWPRIAGEETAEEKAILRVLRAATAAWGIGIVEPPKGDFSPLRSERLRRIAFETVTRNLGREPELDDSQIEMEAASLGGHAARVDRLLRDRRYSWILLPGGVWGASGAYWAACEAGATELTTYDSGEGLLLFQHDGPAAHFPDLMPTMRVLAAECEQSDHVRQNVEKWVDDRLAVRRRGEDEFCLQPVNAAAANRRADVVVPLNYRLDTAAMCRQRLFGSVNEWLHAIKEWAKDHPAVEIVVRQHPCEKIPAFRSKEDYSWVGGANVHLVKPEDPINTYDLLSECRVVLPHSSRVGMEAGVMGKSVILAAHTYYEEMDFASMPESSDAYFAAIEKALADGAQTAAERRSAYAAYFVAENFGLYKTSFTPIPADFERWMEISPEKLWSDSQNAVLLNAAISRRSAASIFLESHLERWAKEAGELLDSPAS